MGLREVAILAIIQGLTELLPVSSSAHVILAERLMGLDPASPSMAFLLVTLHTGTMLAVLVYVWPRWRARLRPPRPPGGATAAHGAPHFIGLVLLATACTGLLGLGLKVVIERVVLARGLGDAPGEVEHLFRNLPLIAGALLAAGGLILLAGARAEGRDGRATVTAGAAVRIGVVQALCLPFRGFSRSGATISTALLCQIPRALAEDFSFALGVTLTPPVVLLELRRLLQSAGGSGLSGPGVLALLGPGVLGMVLSGLAGLLALRWLSAWLEQGRWRYFGYYCCGFAAVVLLVAWRGW
jgi:undecaprenyl-diphosphatase